MDICPICGAERNGHCKFYVPKDEAPWLEDYHLMSTGDMTHEEHQLMVARWNLHHADDISHKVLQWARDIVARYSVIWNHNHPI